MAAVFRQQHAPGAVFGFQEVTGVSDTENPAHTGAITVGAKTSSTIAVTWPTATDNVGVTGYEVSSDNGATYTAVGLVTAHTFTGLTALTSYNLAVRAFDAAGNRSTALTATTSTYRAGALGSTILLTTGPIDGNPAGILYNDVVSPADDAKWFSFVITTPPATGTLDIDPDGTFTFAGPGPETMYYQLEVDGANVGSPVLVTLYNTDSPQTLTASLFTNSQTFYGPTVVRGAVTLSPSLFTNTQAFYTASIAQASPQTLTAPLVVNVQEFFQHRIGDEESFAGEIDLTRWYIRRGKKLHIFDRAEDADAFAEAEKQAEEAASQKTSRRARKRVRSLIVRPEPIQTVDFDALSDVLRGLDMRVDMPALIAQQDYGRLMQVMERAAQMQAMARAAEMQDEMDVEMLLLA